ncbi:MAG: tetratricopeptide repeat protein [Chloroflexota bacterium]|nr:tetratricopeptide repeat protein [Chloroflexota bacterium]
MTKQRELVFMTGEKERFQKALDKGHSAAWDQDWGRAATYYRQALDELPNDMKALTSLGLALFEMHEYEEALEYYSKAAKLFPEDPVSFEKLSTLYEILGNKDLASNTASQAAELYLNRKDVQKAIESWGRAVAAKPENLRPHTRLAIVYERLGKKSKAAIEYLNIVSLLQEKGQTEHAEQAIRRAAKLDPRSEKVKRALQMWQQGIMLPKPAQPHSGTTPLEMDQKLLESHSEEEKEPEASPVEQARQLALSILASVVFEDAGESNAQREDRSLATIMDGGGSVFSGKGDRTRLLLHVSQVIQLQNQRNFQQAAEELRGAIKAGLKHPAAYYNLGYLYLETSNLKGAIDNLSKAVTNANFALGARLLLGQAFREQEKWTKASKEYLEALKLVDLSVSPKSQIELLHQIYDPFIDAQDKEKDTEKQIQICDNIEGILLRPNWKVQLEDITEQFGKDGESRTPLIDVLVETSSNKVVDILTNIQRLARKGLFGAAMEEAFYALKFAPTYLPLHISIGDLLLKKEQPKAAITKFLMVAEAYRVRGKTERAIATLNRVVELKPMDIDIRQNLINLLEDYGRIDDTIEEYLNLAEVHYSLAELSNARDVYAQALDIVQKHQKEADWQVRILHRLADIDTQRLDWASSINIFERICILHPKDKKANMSLVDLHYRMGEDTKAESALTRYLKHMKSEEEHAQVAKFVSRLREEMPQKTALRWLLAQAYENLGKTEEAIAELDTLGELLLDEGNNTQAISVISKIIKLNPPNIEEYQQLLKQLRG